VPFKIDASRLPCLNGNTLSEYFLRVVGRYSMKQSPKYVALLFGYVFSHVWGKR
jgi:hypothetical protein